MDNSKQPQQQLQDAESMFVVLESDFKNVNPEDILDSLKNNSLTQQDFADRRFFTYLGPAKKKIEVTFFQKALLQLRRSMLKNSKWLTWLEIAKVILEHDCPRDNPNLAKKDALLIVLHIMQEQMGEMIHWRQQKQNFDDAQKKYDSLKDILQLILKKQICRVTNKHIESSLYLNEFAIVNELVAAECRQRNSEIHGPDSQTSFITIFNRDTDLPLLHTVLDRMSADHDSIFGDSSLEIESELFQIFKTLVQTYPKLASSSYRYHNVPNGSHSTTPLDYVLNKLLISQEADSNSHRSKKARELLKSIQCLKLQGVDISQVPSMLTESQYPIWHPFQVFIESLIACKNNNEEAAAVVYTGETTLHIAAKNGSMQDLQDLINSLNSSDQQDVFSYKDNKNWTALHVAANRGHVEVVRALLGANAASDAWDSKGRTALHLAANQGHVEVVRELLSLNNQTLLLMADDYYTHSALHLAALKGHLECVQALLEVKNPYLLCLQDKDGHTALHVAAWGGHVKVIQELLREEDASLLTQRDQKGHTALHVAALKGNLECVKALLGVRNIYLLLNQDNSGHTALHLAAWQGHDKVVQELLGVNNPYLPRSQDKDGRTALHVAAWQGHDKVVQALLSVKKQDLLPLQDRDGRTALHVASLKGNLECVKALLGVDNQDLLLMKDNSGHTALHLAALKGNLECVQALLGVDNQDLLLIKNKDDRTALHFAANQGHVEVVRVLLHKSEWLRMQLDHKGHTALYYAQKGKYSDVVQVLNLHRTSDNNEHTALDLGGQKGAPHEPDLSNLIDNLECSVMDSALSSTNKNAVEQSLEQSAQQLPEPDSQEQDIVQTPVGLNRDGLNNVNVEQSLEQSAQQLPELDSQEQDIVQTPVGLNRDGPNNVNVEQSLEQSAQQLQEQDSQEEDIVPTPVVLHRDSLNNVNVGQSLEQSAQQLQEQDSQEKDIVQTPVGLHRDGPNNVNVGQSLEQSAQQLPEPDSQEKDIVQTPVGLHRDGLNNVNDDILNLRLTTSSNSQNAFSHNSGAGMASASTSSEQLSWWQEIWIFLSATVDSLWSFCASVSETICSWLESSREARTMHSPSSVPATTSAASQSLNDSSAPLRREESGIDRRKRKNS